MTSTRVLRSSATEIVRLVREEIATANGQPELNLTISKEYIRRKAPRRRTRSAERGPQLDRVTGFALLTIEPRRERDYWVLKVEVETSVGSRAPYDDRGLESSALTMDEFEEEMRSSKNHRIRLRLEIETSAARRHFDRWLSEMRKRHPHPKRHPSPLKKKQGSRQPADPKPTLSALKGAVINQERSPNGRRAVTNQESVRRSVLLVKSLLPLAQKKLAMLQTDAPLIQAAKLLARKEANLVIICKPTGTLAGVVAKTDIVREFCNCRRSSYKIPVSVAMTRKVISCQPQDFLMDVWSSLKRHGLKHIPIIDPGSRPIGLAIARDVLGLLMEEVEHEEQLLHDYVMCVGYH
jgi:CBS domain-containing protein